MACEIVTTEGAVFALWGTPTLSDVQLVADALRNAAEACGHPVVYITRVPVSAPAPSAEVRARIDKTMPIISQWFSSYHVVLEGVGFGAALKRGILVGLFQLSWRRKTFFVHAEVNEVPYNVEPTLRGAVHDVIGAALARGLLTAAPPVSAPPARASKSATRAA